MSKSARPSRGRILQNAVLALLLTALFALLHLTRLSDTPYGLAVDEVSMGYDAWCLANFGVDRNLDAWPVYLVNYGGGQSAMYAYLTAALIRLTGCADVWILRLPGALFGWMTMVFGGLTVQRLLGKRHPKAWFVFGLFYLVCPYFTMAARIGLDCNLMLGMSTAFLYALIRAVDSQRLRDFVWVGLTAGLTLYTYALSYLALPIFLLMALLWLAAIRRIRAPQFWTVLGLLAAIGWPLVIVQVINLLDLPEFTLGGMTFVRMDLYRASTLSLSDMALNLLRTLKNTLCYDNLPNTSRQFWTLYPLSIPFVVLGAFVNLRAAVRSLRRREWHPAAFIVLWGLTMLLVGSLLGSDGPSTNRVNAIFFVTAECAVAGLFAVCERLRGHFRHAFAGAVAVAYAVYFCFFARWYFGSRQLEALCGNLYPEAFAVIEQSETLSARTVHVPEPPTYYQLSTLISPYDFEMTIVSDRCVYRNYLFDGAKPAELNPDWAYIADVTDTEYIRRLEDAGFRSIAAGEALIFFR